MIFLKNGRKFACRNHNERFDYVTSHKIKYNYEIMFQSNDFSWIIMTCIKNYFSDECFFMIHHMFCVYMISCETHSFYL
jgi:hypothetical protein